ncbi:phage portal protein [Jeotgalibacillus sp. HH7-29]|uniref:Phage portal protein n=1 Tax=Jeotgalibacillus haloalkalitolerans TaxID=3104292 RepID=A0ABU5KM91_9BACL|nr:phage portal protein [Jeotgalibacillus sp. HH7-29]MDZ5712247.1 phage portal protein [Jeotgalibacillus sp. HH7-29]
MGVFDIFSGWLTSNKTSGSLKDCYIYDLQVETFYKRLAIESSTNLIANAIVRSKFFTYEKGKKKRASNYYLFNVAPNQNQNATQFFHELISNLIYENEALAIMINDQLYIADSWEKTEFTLRENIFNKVKSGTLTFDRSFNESEVLYFKLNNERITEVINGLYKSYGKLLAAGMNNYKRSNAMRGLVEMETLLPQTEEESAAREDLFTNQFKNFFQAEGGAVLPISKGMNYKEVKSSSGSNSTSRDIRAIVDDVIDLVSMAFNVPKGLLKGDLADIEGQVDSFLMFCINPIAELLNDEINRKMYSKADYLDRTYLKVDTTMVKYVDPTSLATALDKMLASGLTNVDENRELAGLEPIGEEWAQKHFITKNYQEVEDYLENGPNVKQTSMRGGE